MTPKAPQLPSATTIRSHMLAALGRYWSNQAERIVQLPITEKIIRRPIDGPLRLTPIQLPEWAIDCGVEGSLLIPIESAPDEHQEQDAWCRTDWWLAGFLLLEAWHERIWEHTYGPIHSYSFHLKGWDERAWQHAWVNRIGLFLRGWAAHLTGGVASEIFGPVPETDIEMTHDVDAVAKTLPIRLKQGAFNLFNALRNLRQGQIRQSLARIDQARRFLLGSEDWWTFDKLLQWEAEVGIHATYHFHADPRPKTLKRWLFDPNYDINAPRQRQLLRQLTEHGHTIGLHPGFETWQDATQLASECERVSQAAETQVTHCRQHWLRFSWQSTWSAQQQAGFTHDTTLMFNDRPGFRNSSALAWQPYDQQQGRCHTLIARSSVFMDSHFYDYHSMSAEERMALMQHWLQECRSVSGEVAVLWHPHTLTNDYGWSDGLHDVISLVTEIKTCQ